MNLPPTPEKPILVLVGGFLGAGKTTLLLKAGAILRDRGMRVAIITNDQGGELVDTRMAEAAGLDTAEVTGGCFCCRLSDFLRAADRLLAFQPDVIFAEPVGSCVDIAATVVRPAGETWRVAPFTVLVDPARAADLAQDEELLFLFRNQLAEADLVCFTKADLHTGFPDLGAAYRLSARTGEGVAEWLDEMLGGKLAAGGRRLDIDYDRYAAAEAALGWLNWQADARLRRALSPAALVGPFLDELDRLLTAAGIPIAHLKVFDRAATGYLKASVCRNGEEPLVDGMLDAAPSTRHDIVLNLRARATPDQLRAALESAVALLPRTIRVRHCEVFSPARPQPERRL